MEAPEAGTRVLELLGEVAGEELVPTETGGTTLVAGAEAVPLEYEGATTAGVVATAEVVGTTTTGVVGATTGTEVEWVRVQGQLVMVKVLSTVRVLV